MSEYILYNGRVREVHGRFSNMILYKENKEVKGTSLLGAKFCDKLGNLLPEDAQQEIKGDTVIQAESLVKETQEEMTVRIGNNNPLPKVEREGGKEGEVVEKEGRVHDLNRINTETEIRLVAADVSGLGVKTLRTIVENRPEGGYHNLEHLKEVNGDSIPKNLKWSAMEQYLIFS